MSGTGNPPALSQTRRPTRHPVDAVALLFVRTRNSYPTIPGTEIVAGAKRGRRSRSAAREAAQGSVVYVHTEQFRVLCRSCWADPGVDHADHGPAEHRVVAGKVCAPPSISAAELLAALDSVVAEDAGVKLFVPDLAEQADRPDRAAVDRRRMEMIESS